MRYTILSARFANADHTAAVVMTEEAAAVLLGASEDADLWPAVLETEPTPCDIKADAVPPPAVSAGPSGESQP